MQPVFLETIFFLFLIKNVTLEIEDGQKNKVQDRKAAADVRI